MVNLYQSQDKPVQTASQKEAVNVGSTASTAIFISQAQHNRNQAKRARRLAASILTLDVIETLKKYADELEELAREFDRRAATIAVKGE
jgi:hypothetical protein